MRKSNLKMLRLFFWNEIVDSGRYLLKFWNNQLLPTLGLKYTHQTTRRHILDIYSLNKHCLGKPKFENVDTAV
jgi:hypothetical protein